MRLWLLLIGALIVQELASTNVALLAAVHAGYSEFIIALIFVGATALDLAAGYAAGSFVKKRFAGRPAVARIERAALRAERYVGARSERLMLVLLGLVSFCYVNAFLAAWLKLPPAEALAYVAAGDAVWYGLEWFLVLGATALSKNFMTELYIIVGASLAILVASRYLSKHVLKDT